MKRLWKIRQFSDMLNDSDNEFCPSEHSGRESQCAVRRKVTDKQYTPTKHNLQAL
jgi:hypothetical protein